MHIALDFVKSSRSLKNVRVITGVALFCALQVVMASFNVYLTPSLRISFGFLACAASCYFYGPVPNLIAAVIVDFMGYMVNPVGGYQPWWMINAMFQAFVFAVFFYDPEGDRPVAIWKILAAELLVVLVNNLLLNPLWLSMLYGDSYWVLAGARLVKNAIMYPINCALLVLVLRLCQRLKKSLPALRGF